MRGQACSNAFRGRSSEICGTLAAAAENLRAQLRRERQLRQHLSAAVPSRDRQCRTFFAAQTINDRDLAPGERQARRWYRQLLPLAVDIKEAEPAGLWRELAGAQQPGIKAEFTTGDPHAQFAKAGQHLFLDLAGHPGLLGAAMPGRMRIGVCRECSILDRRLVKPMPSRTR